MPLPVGATPVVSRLLLAGETDWDACVIIQLVQNLGHDLVEARDDLSTAQVSQMTGMSDVDLTRRAKDGVVKPSGSSGRRGRGGSRTYNAADVGALDALATLRALGVPLESAKPIVNEVQSLPGWNGRGRCDGLVCLNFDDFPERLYYNGREVTETEPAEAGAIVLRVRPLVASQLVRAIVLQEEPYMRFARLQCLATREDYIGESAASLLTRAVFGVKKEARELASFLGFQKGSKAEAVIVELCAEDRAAFEEYEAAEMTDGDEPQAEAPTDVQHPKRSEVPRQSDGGKPVRCETAQEAIEASLISGRSSMWFGSPTELIELGEELGYEVDFNQGGQEPDLEAKGVYLTLVVGKTPSTPFGDHDWFVGVWSKLGPGRPAPVISRCEWCGRFEDPAGAEILRQRFAEVERG